MKLKLQKYHRLLEIVDVDQVGNVAYRKNGKTVPVHENIKNHYLVGMVWDAVASKNLHFNVQTLVAVRWLGDPPEGTDQVSHLDESRHNNCVSNLTWASAKENSNMPLRRKRLNFEKMSAAMNRLKKKVAQFTLRGELVAEFESVNAAARAVAGNPGGISNCCGGLQPTCYGFAWRWA